jgi:penicillin-binding protein 2
MNQYLPNSEMEAKEYGPRYKLVYGFISLTAILFFMRLWHLQIINGAELRAFSEQNSIKETKIPAPRGIVYDRNREILVENLPGFEASISPQYIGDLNKTAEVVGHALNMPPANVIALVQRSKRMNGPFRPVRIKENLSRDEIFSLEMLKLDYTGIDIKETVLRSYPYTENGAQLFGYVAEISKKQLPILNEKYAGKIKFQQGDVIGRSGIEEVLDISVRGKDGISVQQVDARGREAVTEMNLLGNMAGIQEATPGNNVVLTIDKDVQRAAFDAMAGEGKIGAVVAMKSNGEILAWVSSPSFDPNSFSAGITAQVWSKLINDPDKPLRNKVIQDTNSPGSTFKPIMAVAALSEKVISPSTLVACPGQMRFGNRVYHDHKKEGHGVLTVKQAIERSSNIFFYKQGISLGVDRIYKYANALGIGHRTGVDLNRENSGLMPNTDWKKNTIGEEWQPGENLSVAIGQGFVLTNPLQMAVAYNAIGTGGKVVRPFVIKQILGPDNKVLKEFEPSIVKDLTDPNGEFQVRKEVFDTVKEGMRLVVNGDHGTARGSVKLGYIEVAGKTGTSQVMSFSADQIYLKCENRPKKQRHHGWFIGYAPADNPEIAFGILAEHSCHGASGAGPIAKAIVDTYYRKYHPDFVARELEKKAKKGKLANPAPASTAPVPERIEGE